MVHILSQGMTSRPAKSVCDSRVLIEYDELFSGSPLATSGLQSQRWETEEETSPFTRLLKCKADGENIAANASAHRGRLCLSGDGKVIPHVRGTRSEEPLDHPSHIMIPGVPRFVLFVRVPSLYKKAPWQDGLWKICRADAIVNGVNTHRCPTIGPLLFVIRILVNSSSFHIWVNDVTLFLSESIKLFNYIKMQFTRKTTWIKRTFLEYRDLCVWSFLRKNLTILLFILFCFFLNIIKNRPKVFCCHVTRTHKTLNIASRSYYGFL